MLYDMDRQLYLEDSNILHTFAPEHQEYPTSFKETGDANRV